MITVFEIAAADLQLVAPAAASNLVLNAKAFEANIALMMLNDTAQ